MTGAPTRPPSPFRRRNDSRQRRGATPTQSGYLPTPRRYLPPGLPSRLSYKTQLSSRVPEWFSRKGAPASDIVRGELRITILKRAGPKGVQGAQDAFKNSTIRRVCNSQHLSQFAAFFIDLGAEGSTVKD